MKKIAFCILPFVTLILVSCSKPDMNPVLTIEGGQVKGVETQTAGIVAYKGIPFAAPPIEELRWKGPQPVVPWGGVKIADTYGAASMQVPWDPESFYGKEWRASGSVPISEDCLYLNIWTPAAGKVQEKLPVAMWIHGGGYREGFAFEPEMDGGEDWASRGVILVSVTYRLGVLGFFAHPLLSEESPYGVSGNYGSLDQAAALQWIHNNIEQFGGDPDNITIFGQSAGAGSVKTLVASPLSRDLVSKAIIMSGGGLGERRPATPLDTAQAKNQAMMDYFDKTTLEEMRALTFDELLEMSTVYGDTMKTRMFFSPVVDGYFLKNSFTETAKAGEISDIPYMIGFTSNDMGDQTESVSDFCALRETQSDQPAYAYLFQRQLPGSDHGAFHSSDLWYVFHSLRHSWRPFTAGDEQLSNAMMEYYTNFARFGNPNGLEAGTWTPFTKESPAYMILDAGESEAKLTMSDAPKHTGAAALR